jgi:hypothetical protein
MANDTTLADLGKQSAALKDIVLSVKNAQKWSDEFGKTQDRVRAGMAKLFDVEKKSTEEINKTTQAVKTANAAQRDFLVSMQMTAQMALAPKKMADEYRNLKAEMREAALAGSKIGRAAQAVGVGHGGFREAAKTGARNVMGAVGVDTFNPWALAAKAAMAVATKAAEATRNSLNLLITTGGKLTAENVLGTSSQVAVAFAKNTMVALKWGASLEEVNSSMLHFSERTGLSVEESQKFTERLAKGARMMGVDFGDAAEFASDQMTNLGKSSEDTLKVLDTVSKVSKLSAAETGHMGEKAGKTGGIFAKDLLKSVREVSKETGLFKNQNELLAIVMGNVYQSAVKVGASYGQAKDAMSGFGKVLGSVGEYGRSVAGAPVRKQILGMLPEIQKKISALETKARGQGGQLGAGEAEELRKLKAQRSTAKYIKPGGVFGGEVALGATMAGQFGPEAAMKALRGLAKQAATGEGAGRDYVMQTMKQAGIAYEQQGMVLEALQEVAKGKEKGALTPEQQKALDKFIGVAHKQETAEQKLVSKMTQSTDVMGALVASLNKLAGHVAEMVLNLGKFVAAFRKAKFMGRSLFPDEETDKPAEPKTAEGTKRALKSASDIFLQEQGKGRSERPLTAEEKANLAREDLVKVDVAPEKPGKPKPKPRVVRGRGKPGRGKPGAPVEAAPPGALPPEEIQKGFEGFFPPPKIAPVPGSKGAAVAPGAAPPKILPTTPEPEAPKTAAAGVGGGGKGGGALASAGRSVTGDMKRNKDGTTTVTFRGLDEALSSYEADKAEAIAASKARG